MGEGEKQKSGKLGLLEITGREKNVNKKQKSQREWPSPFLTLFCPAAFRKRTFGKRGKIVLPSHH